MSVVALRSEGPPVQQAVMGRSLASRCGPACRRSCIFPPAWAPGAPMCRACGSPGKSPARHETCLSANIIQDTLLSKFVQPDVTQPRADMHAAATMHALKRLTVAVQSCLKKSLIGEYMHDSIRHEAGMSRGGTTPRGNRCARCRRTGERSRTRRQRAKRRSCKTTSACSRRTPGPNSSRHFLFPFKRQKNCGCDARAAFPLHVAYTGRGMTAGYCTFRTLSEKKHAFWAAH